MSEVVTNEENGRQTPKIIIKQAPQRKSNGLGTAGFVLVLIGISLCWIPVVGQIFIGVFKSLEDLQS